jgi:CHAT domain-containing protein
MRFKALYGTAEEAKSLRETLPTAKVLTGDKATESALKQVRGPTILHIATHGFFLSDQPRNPVISFDPLMTEYHLLSEQISKYENPMLRSGLALAGANHLDGGDGNDGVLTAIEAAGLDLGGTRLVMLSACDTAIGVLRNGEGVYGLRRAFILAGAHSEVMSLWRVDDDATQKLVVAYYRRLILGETRSEALRQVQLNMIKSPDRHHPFFWASFIQIGSWQSMKLEAE